MKVGVTAAGGFLGRHVCAKLVESGHSVVGIDQRPITDIELHVGRAKDQDLTRVFDGCEVVIHLEWSGSFKKASLNPLETEASNNSTLFHVLNAAKTLRSRVVFASTGIVYGGNLDCPTRETEDVQPRSYYGLQKLNAEGLVRIASDLGSFDSICVRVFNLFGHGATDSAQIIPRLFQAHKDKQSFKLTGDGMQSRDLIAVEDAAVALCKLATLQGYKGEVFNLGSGVGTTMKHLVETFYELQDEKPNIEWVQPVPGESKTLIADMNKTMAEIGPQAMTSLRDGLKVMIQRV